MSFMLVTQKVTDFDDWKSNFDSKVDMRRKSGLIDLHVLRDDSDPDTVIVLLGTTDLGKAREFTSSGDWQASIQDPGAPGQPEVRFLNEAHYHGPR